MGTSLYREVTNLYVQKKRKHPYYEGETLFTVFTADNKKVEIGTLKKWGGKIEVYFITGDGRSFATKTVKNIIFCLRREYGIIKQESFFYQSKDLVEIIKLDWNEKLIHPINKIWSLVSRPLLIRTIEHRGIEIKEYVTKIDESKPLFEKIEYFLLVNNEISIGPLNTQMNDPALIKLKGNIDLFSNVHSIGSYCNQCDKKYSCNLVNKWETLSKAAKCEYPTFMTAIEQKKEAKALLTFSPEKHITSNDIAEERSKRFNVWPDYSDAEYTKIENLEQLCRDLLYPSDMQ